MNRFSEKSRIVPTVPILLAQVLGLSAGCRHPAMAEPLSDRSFSPDAGQVRPVVRTLVPEKIRFVPEILATGTLKPEQSADLATAVPGTLQRVFVKRGDEVKAGAVLAVLDADAARASLDQAGAGVEAAEAQLRLAEDGLRRTSAMRKDEAVPESQLVQIQGQRDLSLAQVHVATAQREQARVLLRNHTLVAPFAGVIIRAPDGIGMPVGPQAPLFVIENLRSLLLETSLTQEEAADLAPNAAVTVVVPATGKRVAEASVRLVIPSVDPATNRVPIEIAVPNTNRTLLPHAFARAELRSRGERDAYRVPQSALVQREGEFSLWTIAEDGKLHAVRVRVLGHKDDGSVVVDPGPNGFREGQEVVGAPPESLGEGSTLSTLVGQAGRP